MAEDGFTPSSAAIKLTHWLDAFASATGAKRVPVDVPQLALEVGQQLQWPDRITTVEAAPIKSFEGGLFYLGEQGWALLYNEQITAPGRVRFTQAHELGHYLLHRLKQDGFECSQDDMTHWGPDQKNIEAEADSFAAQWLMPMNHFRVATGAPNINFEVLSDASDQFGMSLTAVALRWVQSTTESAVLVMSRDGFMIWAVSSDRARKNGAFFRTRNRAVEVPEGTLAANEAVATSRIGQQIGLKTWFEHAHPDAAAREMKLVCDNHGYTLSLLHLSPSDQVWEPREWGDRS